MTILKHLEWDSRFFGYGVASLNADSVTLEEYQGIAKKLRDENFRVAYCFVKPDDPVSVETFEKIAGNPVDIKITYSKPIDSFANSELPSGIHVYGNTTVSEKLRQLTLQSGVYSRFRIDPRFRDNEYEKLYTEWIVKSVNGEKADEVLVYREDDEICGFITLSKSHDTGILGLIAVDTGIRGKSIGKKLLLAAEFYFSQNGIKTIDVATQKANLIACAFYESFGYKVKDIINVYHLWIL